MAVTEGDVRLFRTGASWRTPLVIIACGCVIALLSFGPRSSLGFFIQPMSREFSWGRDVFGLALALQNLLWGLGQPVAGAIADRFGVLRVMCIGAILYAGGLLVMRYAATPLSLDLGAGVLIGFGLSGCSFNLVLSAFSKLLPPERRGIALGAGTAAGSFGQFLFAPFGVAMIDNFGWQMALTVFAGLMLLIIPLSLALATPPATTTQVPVADQQSFKTALAEAFGHRSYVLLVLGFFTCGFQLAFNGAADIGAGGPDVRHALVCDAVWICLRQPSGRRLSRRIAGRHRVRKIRFLHPDLVAVGHVRRAVGADQPADCRGAGGATSCATGLDGSKFKNSRTKRLGELALATFKAIRIDKADKGTTAALTPFDEAELMEGDVTVRVEWSALNYKDGLAVTGKAPVVRR